MAVESWPNVPHNNRAVSLPEHERLVAPASLTGLTSAVVAKPADADATGLQLKIKDGTSGLIEGTAFYVDGEEVVDGVAANNSGQPRIDLLVMRLTRPGYTIAPAIIQGVAAANPVAPSPVRQKTPGSGVFDLPLAEYDVLSGATTITAGQARNRTWWISGGGYVGTSGVRPPAEANAVFQETDTGRIMIGTAAGAWRRLAQNSGFVTVTNIPGGWGVGQFSSNRLDDMVELVIRLHRSGGSTPGNQSFVIGKVVDEHRPLLIKQDLFHCSLPNHTGIMQVDTDGWVTLMSRGTTTLPVNTGATIISTLHYTARP